MLLSLAPMSFTICSLTRLVELPESTVTQNLLWPFCICNFDEVVRSSVVSIMFTEYSSAGSPYVECISACSNIMLILSDDCSIFRLSTSFIDRHVGGLFKITLQFLRSDLVCCICGTFFPLLGILLCVLCPLLVRCFSNCGVYFYCC